MKTGIIILNYNNYYDTINCIQSVYQHCFDESLLTVIVDNGSDNDSIIQISTFLQHNKFNYKILNIGQEIKNEDGSIVIIPTNENLGYARGNNVGIRFLIDQNVENILILNNDILFTSNIIKPLIDCLNNHPEIGLITPLIVNDDNTIAYNCCRKKQTNKFFLFESLNLLKLPFIQNIFDQKYPLKTNPALLNEQLVFCDIVLGACIMAKTTTWKNLKGFDENTFLFFEENILFEKLNRLKLLTAVYTTSSIIHLGGKSIHQVKSSKLLKMELDSLIYFLKNYRNISSFKISLIKQFKLFNMGIIAIHDYLKSFGKKNH